jgi:trimethyllysine dioxygenase
LPHWRRLVEAINSAEHVERIRLAPGQCLVVDNQRVLHGRTAFAGGVREMVGCYIGRDEYESRLRAFGILEMQG